MTKEVLEQQLPGISPFEVKQAIVGLQLGPADNNLLRYLHFLTGKIKFEAAQWLHVQPDFAFVTFFLEHEMAALVDQYELDKELLQELTDLVNFQIKGKDKIKMTYKVLGGDPLKEVLGQSEKIEADLLVIGQRTGSGYHHILAKNLVRKSACDALIVPGRAKHRLEAILVPVDFSPNSARALKTGLGIQQQLGAPAKVMVLYTYKVPKVNLSKINQTWDGYSEIVRRNIRESLQHFIANIDEDYKDKVEIILKEQSKLEVSKSILEIAENEKADLLVMGAKGQSKVQRLLMGSVTETVVNQNESVPVLVVK